MEQFFTCTFCDREYDAKKGLKIYLSQFALKRTQVNENNKTYNEDIIDENVYSETQNQIDTMLILMQEELPVVRDVNLNQPYLPQYKMIKRIQTATGLQDGAEAAIQPMKNIFEDDETEAVILVDASNAFNSFNRVVALHNVQVLRPQFSPILINNYREASRMIVLGKDEIMS